LKIDEYINVLNAYTQHKSVDSLIAYCDMNDIQSNRHKVYSKTTDKLVLNANDDKSHKRMTVLIL
jgi:hypothetical protein